MGNFRTATTLSSDQVSELWSRFFAAALSGHGSTVEGVHVHNITQHAPIMLALLAHAHTSSGRLAACLAGTSTTRGHHQHRLPDAVDTVFAEPARPRSKVEMSRSAARYARSWPRPRRPSPWHALCTREPLSSPGMGHGSLAPLTSHGTRSLPCAQVRVGRVRVHVPAAIPVFRLQPDPPRPARGYRSKNGEDPSSWARERSRASSGLDR